MKILNEMSLADIVNNTGIWLYQPLGSRISNAIA